MIHNWYRFYPKLRMKTRKIEKRMEYVYTSIYRFEGISDGNLDDDKVIYESEDNKVTVIITKDLNKHCHIIDIGVVCAHFLLLGKEGHKKLESEEDIELQALDIRHERDLKKKIGQYIVIQFKGQASETLNEKTTKETEQFILAFDAIDKNTIKDKHKDQISSVLASFAISLGAENHIFKEIEGLHFRHWSGKTLYSYSFEVGNPRVILSKTIENQKEIELQKAISDALAYPQMKTSFRLLSESLQFSNERLRSFMAGWHALEIFINKAFSGYEDAFINNVLEHQTSKGTYIFMQQIKKVMNGKYRITDKFVLIASFLSDDIDSDIESFKKFKSKRDDISHGAEVEEESLPAEEIRKFTILYLKLHMQTQEL
jgi:hypothetical protein